MCAWRIHIHTTHAYTPKYLHNNDDDNNNISNNNANTDNMADFELGFTIETPSVRSSSNSESVFGKINNGLYRRRHSTTDLHIIKRSA